MQQRKAPGSGNHVEKRRLVKETAANRQVPVWELPRGASLALTGDKRDAAQHAARRTGASAWKGSPDRDDPTAYIEALQT